MLRILKIISRFLFKKIVLHIGAILLAINLVLVGTVGYFSYNSVITLKYIERILDVITFGQQKQMEDIYDTLTVMLEGTLIIDKSQTELISDILEKLDKLETIQKDVKTKAEKAKTLDLENAKEIKASNFLIYNETAGYGGSGTHIRYGNKDYILTCAHLIKGENDLMIAVENESGEKVLLESVHYDKDYDLALFRMKKVMKHVPVLEISEEFPEVGSEVIVIGNPSMFEDVVTDGVIAKIENKTYITTNKVFCGNSGGAVLYKGKIVGVLSAMQIMFNFPQLENYAIAINLKTIKRFLEDCNLE